MELEIFTLCDFAQDVNGKLTIVGTFDSLASAKFPCMHPNCSIATRIRFSEKEIGHHKLQLYMKHNGSEAIPHVEAALNVKVGPGGYSTTNLVLNMSNLLLKEPGKYTIELHVDEQWAGGLTLSVNKAA